MFNYIAFVITGVTGIIINIFIIKSFNAEVLGNFNFNFSLLLILSQFAVGGIQFSVLKHNSHYAKKLSEVSKLIISALLLSTFFCIIVLLGLYSSISVLEKIFHLKNFDLSIYLIMPAILFFSLNKILIISMNGLNLMKEFAVFNALRFILLMFFVICFYYSKIDEKYIVAVFSVSEFVLLCLVSVFLYTKLNLFSKPRLYWIKRHFYFGIKGMLGGALITMNSRIDILFIGFFLGYSAVGIYSFASMIAEGFAQLYTILKNNIDPLVGNAYYKKDYKKIYEIIINIRKKYIPFIVVFGILLLLSYKFIFINIFNLDNLMITKSWYVLIVLVSFMIIASYYKPFFGFLNQINHPLLFSKIVFFSVCINIILNIFLIPIFGIYGAAFSTGLVFFIESYLLLYVAKKKINYEK